MATTLGAVAVVAGCVILAASSSGIDGTDVLFAFAN